MCPGREREREREGGKERDGERERVCVCVCEGERKAGKRGSACVSIPRYARNSYGKRDLIIRQKRPIHTAKETYSYGKRDLCTRQKRPIETHQQSPCQCLAPALVKFSFYSVVREHIL